MFQKHQLPRASALHCLTEWWWWHVPVGFDPSPRARQDCPRSNLQVKPGLSQWARLHNRLWSLRVSEKGTKGSASHISSSAKRAAAPGLSQGHELSPDLWCNRLCTLSQTLVSQPVQGIREQMSIPGLCSVGKAHNMFGWLSYKLLLSTKLMWHLQLFWG